MSRYFVKKKADKIALNLCARFSAKIASWDITFIMDARCIPPFLLKIVQDSHMSLLTIVLCSEEEEEEDWLVLQSSFFTRYVRLNKVSGQTLPIIHLASVSLSTLSERIYLDVCDLIPSSLISENYCFWACVDSEWYIFSPLHFHAIVRCSLSNVSKYFKWFVEEVDYNLYLTSGVIWSLQTIKSSRPHLALPLI